MLIPLLASRLGVWLGVLDAGDSESISRQVVILEMSRMGLFTHSLIWSDHRNLCKCFETSFLRKSKQIFQKKSGITGAFVPAAVLAEESWELFQGGLLATRARAGGGSGTCAPGDQPHLESVQASF